MKNASAPRPRATLRCGRALACAALACAALAALGTAAHGQTGTVSGGLDSVSLLRPPQDSWPTYHGDYSGRRNSALSQITPDNVRALALQWAFQTNQAQQIKATPILVDGIV